MGFIHKSAMMQQKLIKSGPVKTCHIIDSLICVFNMTCLHFKLMLS